MQKCVFCGSEQDLFSLEMTHLEEEYGRFDRKVCGKCWEAVFEIALKAAKKAIEDLESQTEGELEILHPRTPEEKAKLDSAWLVFQGYRAVVSDPENITCNLEGRPYVYMHQIRNETNKIIGEETRFFSPQAVGNILRNHLKFVIGKRHGTGVPVYINKDIVKKLEKSFRK